MPIFKVEGMTCSHCERAVTEAIRRVDPAAQVEIDLSGGTVKTNSRAKTGRLAEAIRSEGYQAQAVTADG